MIETRLLRYFLAVARERNITKAARSLFITQSTLSKQMMDLEKQLGKQLFVRGKRSTHPDGGRHFSAQPGQGDSKSDGKHRGPPFRQKPEP